MKRLVTVLSKIELFQDTCRIKVEKIIGNGDETRVGKTPQGVKRCWVLTPWCLSYAKHLEVLGVDDMATPRGVNTMAKTPSELKTPQ